MTNMLLSLQTIAPNNIVFVCISHIIDSLIKELGIDNSLNNPILYPDKTFENVLYTGMIMLDLQKAFDTVDHRILCNKLQSMGINQMV